MQLNQQQKKKKTLNEKDKLLKYTTGMDYAFYFNRDLGLKTLGVLQIEIFIYIYIGKGFNCIQG
jgi:hypothetical protein